MRLSLNWAERSRRAFGDKPGKAIFGIVQGGDQEDLRVASAEALAAMDFPGYAIGGLAVGEPQSVMLAMIETVAPCLPVEKPRYLMGVGTPDDLVESVARGIDMFDCVMPTRAGRHGLAYTRFGKVNLRNARHAEDSRPLDEEAEWPATREYSRAYLHHSDTVERNSRHDAADVNQPRLLPEPDGRHAQGNCRWQLRGLPSDGEGRVGGRRHRACLKRRNGIRGALAHHALRGWLTQS